MKYFFHMEDGTCIRDPQGEEFRDDGAALREAVNVARGLAEQGVSPQWSVVVKDENDRQVGSVPLAPHHEKPIAEMAAKH